ncbi:MAG: transporter substrate-binding domain-containing protein [Holophagales bacterium]|nr:transporter substrate-binding domain-containing protein [Holophagales bacterium]MYF03819.1 transporter substrate-binding domain-containing protein [Holophagales bacterium]MYJ24982.1 transporter substrate-binding domain-containing protein [Holophagales bacterium]
MGARGAAESAEPPGGAEELEERGVTSASVQRRIALLLAALLLPAALACRGAGDEPLRWVDWAGETHRQVVVDREPGQYLGHPTTVLLSDERSILTVYPKGHGAGPIVMKRSEDGGLTWSERLPTPASWATSMETPTVFPVDLADGRRRLIMFSGLYPVRMARSDDEGGTWTELEPIGHFGGVVAMSSVERLRSLDGELMALFHDDGRFFRRPTSRYERIPGFEPEFRVYKTISIDDGLTWSEPEVIAEHPEAHLCEPGLIRSPDGREIAVLLRENSRQFNSFVVFSPDEGRTWSRPVELPSSLTGDRHVGRYTPDGRLFITFRDQEPSSPWRGDWVGWLGRYEDLRRGGREPWAGEVRVRLMDNRYAADTAYPGLELLPDGTFVTTTYGHFTPGEEPWVASVRFTAVELDEASSAAQTNVPAKPVLRVGTSGDYPPFSIVEGVADEETARLGFDIEVAERLASDLGFDLDFRPFDWPELAASMAADDFDLAMSGVTWRPGRAAVGWMSRAVAAGGPCVVSSAAAPEPPRRVAVNRGGILERWTRERLGGDSEIIAVDDNLSLPGRLERDEVDAFVTDSFEVEHFGRDGWRRRCEPPIDRKVFWVAPDRADQLGLAVDRWIQRNEHWLEARRQEWFGRGQHRDELDHLLDLTARRLAFMQPVASWKSARGVPIEDLEREQAVLEAAERSAARFGLDPKPVRDWFALQIDLAKAVQRRAPEVAPTLELEAIRPALIRLGERQVRSLRALRSQAGSGLSVAGPDLQVLTPYLTAAEVERVGTGIVTLLADLASAR